jgi:hypothetical protein
LRVIPPDRPLADRQGDAMFEMKRYLPAIAIAAYMAAAVAILPSFTPRNSDAAPAKADQVQVAGFFSLDGGCASQNWPNIDAACLRYQSRDDIKPVRMVTTDRRSN